MKEELFYVWQIDELRLVYVEDMGVHVVGGRLIATEREWFDAKRIGDELAEKKAYRVEYFNEAGRWAESEFGEPEGEDF